MRGNYSEADFRRQQTFSDGEVEMENPYMVQNNPGSAFSQSGESTAGPGLGWFGWDGVLYVCLGSVWVWWIA